MTTATQYTSELYPGLVPPAYDLGTEQRLVVVHCDPAYYDGTTCLELRTYRETTFLRRGRERTEKQLTGAYPLRWLEGYPTDHDAGVCDVCEVPPDA